MAVEYYNWWASPYDVAFIMITSALCKVLFLSAPTDHVSLNFARYWCDEAFVCILHRAPLHSTCKLYVYVLLVVHMKTNTASDSEIDIYFSA